MAHVGNVAHVAHLIAQMAEVTEQHIERNGGTGVAQMGVAVDGGTADIHAHVGGVQRLKALFLARERIVNN